MATLDGSHSVVALVVVDAHSHVLHLNDSAAGLLDRNDGLCVRCGTLQAWEPSADSVLRLSIAEAREATLLCRRPSGKWPYVIHLVPAVSQAILVVIDPDDKPTPSKHLLRKLFGMTDSEAEVALRVLNGDGLAPIAERLHLSRATVKTHLQHVFDKTHTHRQAELVRLLLAVVP